MSNTNYARVSELVAKYNPVVSELCDIMAKYAVPQQDGEEILAWLLGLSKGQRQASLIDHKTFETMSVAWFYGADEQGKDEEVSGDKNG